MSVDALIKELNPVANYEKAGPQIECKVEDAIMELKSEDIKNFASVIFEKMQGELSVGDVCVIAKSLSRLDDLLHPPETDPELEAKVSTWHAWMTEHGGRLPSYHREFGKDEDDHKVEVEKKLFLEMADWLCGRETCHEAYKVGLRDFVNFQAVVQTISKKRKLQHD